MFTIPSKIYIFAMLSTTLSLINAMESTEEQQKARYLQLFQDQMPCILVTMTDMHNLKIIYAQQSSEKFRPYVCFNGQNITINNHDNNDNRCFKWKYFLQFLPLKTLLQSFNNTYHGHLQIGSLLPHKFDIGIVLTSGKKFKPFTKSIINQTKTLSFNPDDYAIVPCTIKFICNNQEHIHTLLTKSLTEYPTKAPFGLWQTEKTINQAVDQEIVTISNKDKQDYLNMGFYSQTNSYNQVFQPGKFNPFKRSVHKKAIYGSVHEMVQRRQIESCGHTLKFKPHNRTIDNNETDKK